MAERTTNLMADVSLYLAQFIAAALYAAVLEFGFKRRYEPGYTWLTVVWGTAQTGLLIAVRLLLAPLPTGLTGSELVWWGWWLWTNSFVAAGLPIIIWQVALQSRRVRDALSYISGGTDAEAVQRKS